jgi:hypothetical protein
MIKIICELWNNGIRDVSEIGKIVKLHKVNVIKYLKQGDLLNWCNYELTYSKGKNGKSIVQLTKEGKYISEFESQAEAARKLGISAKSISNVCTGKKKSAGGFKWILKDNYEFL